MKTICFIEHHLKISLQGFSNMSQKPTILFWVVAIVSLLWNLLGCWNYIIQQDPLVVANMSEVYQFIIENRPTWATAAFAVSVFGGAVGSILLLLRRKTATGLFTLSLLGSTAITYFTYRVIGLDPATVSAFIMAFAMLLFSKISERREWIN